MDMNWMLKYILSGIVFSPVIGILLILFFLLFASYDKSNNRFSLGFTRLWLLIISVGSASLSLIMNAILFSRAFLEKFNLVLPLKENSSMFDSIGFKYALSADGLSLVMMFLSSFITIACLIVFWKNKVYSSNRPALGTMMILALQTCCLGAFCSNDLILFYIFFEASLIPMIFIIGIWGRENRVYAALKLFIYTAFGSMFFLFVIVCLKYLLGSTDIDTLKTLAKQFPDQSTVVKLDHSIDIHNFDLKTTVIFP